MNLDTLTAVLRRHEGLRLKPYLDTTGHWTIGYGRKMSNGVRQDEAELMLRNRGVVLPDASTAAQQMTLAFKIGNDIHSNGIRQDEAELMLRNDIESAAAAARAVVPSWAALADARQIVLVSMAFNLGRSGLAGFLRMLDAIDREVWAEAAAEMFDSRWAQQIGGRSVELAHMMRSGQVRNIDAARQA